MNQKSRLARTITYYGLMAASLKITQDWIHRGKNKFKYSITVNEDDPMFPHIHEWILKDLPPDKQRALLATSAKGEEKLKMFFSSTVPQTIKYNGHKIKVVIVLEDSKEGQKNELNTGGFIKNAMLRSRFEINFTVFSLKGRAAVVDLLTDICNTKLSSKKDASYLYTPTTWNEWRRRGSYKSRTLDSIYLPDAIKNLVVDDMRRFLDNEETYHVLGVPYHRGYLFHGPPGGGKTSLAKALGDHFKLDVYYAPLADLKKDADFGELLANLGDRSILLLEDIDILRSSNDRTKVKSRNNGLSLAGFLNALDGVITPHGLITVMTTNDISMLDSALVRTGRTDHILHLDYMGDEQLAKLLNAIGIRKQDLPSIAGLDIPPSDFIQAILPHMYGAEGDTLKAIKKVISKKMKMLDMKVLDKNDK